MTALAEPADIRTFLSLNANQDEALLLILCDAASAFVLNYLNRDSLAVTEATELYDGTGTRLLVPMRRPITAIAALKISGRSIPLSTGYAVNGYIFDKHSITLRGHLFERDLRNVEITYSSGYAATPKDVKQAVVELVAEKFQRRTRMGISSKSIGQESISYSQNDMAPHTKLALNEYRIRYYG